jgi:5-methyltetrahydropteroyltriglutamate--homocysteine methyltransferase
MQRSETRILTTHAGSLPRPKALVELFVRVSRRERVDAVTLAAAVEDATRVAVTRQLEVGIDVGNDGEQSRESFLTYVQHRLSGFGGESNRPIMRDLVTYPSFLTLKLPDFSRTMVNLMRGPQAVAEVRHADRVPLERECDLFTRVAGTAPGRFVERFMTAASPGIVAAALLNAHYAHDDDYVSALAEALRPEYEFIAAQGLVLQVDCPDLAMERHTAFADRPLADFLAYVERNIAALNRSLANVPPAQVRLHVCWGNYEGPHHLDVPLEDILDRLYAARVGALVLSMANPRHAHEHRVLARHPLPADWCLVAGVIDPTTNYVEHP